MSSPLEHAAPHRCENCGALLQGRFCARCGQSVINPVRHAGHALEEVFESFWHLDGRVFRTLRDLLVPARVACNYLAGHRARYIAPLRLFVVLSVLTFFVGQMTVDFSDAAVQVRGGEASIAAADTVAEVERRRDAALAALGEGRADARGVPGVAQGLAAAEAGVRADAAARIAELQRTAPSAAPAGAAKPSEPAPGAAPVTAEVASTAPAGAGAGAAAPADADADADAAGAGAGARKSGLRFFGGEPWDAKTNPLTVPWLPAFANAWLNAKIGRAVTNAPRLKDDAELRKRVILGSVPTALFVLMPLFALLLKLAYIGKRRLYLEHLVVALYSHAFLLLALLAVFVMVGLENWLVPHAAAAGTVLRWLEVAVWWWMPIYLLIMQKRVYGQGWTITSLKYFALGTAYLVLVGFAAFFAGVAGLAKL